MTAKQRAAKQQALNGAMANLVHNSNFREFIDLLRDHREMAVLDICTEAVMKCPRLTMACIGEIKHYNQTIAAYEEFLGRAEEPSDEQHEGS